MTLCDTIRISKKKKKSTFFYKKNYQILSLVYSEGQQVPYPLVTTFPCKAIGFLAHFWLKIEASAQ